MKLYKVRLLFNSASAPRCGMRSEMSCVRSRTRRGPPGAPSHTAPPQTHAAPRPWPRAPPEDRWPRAQRGAQHGPRCCGGVGGRNARSEAERRCAWSPGSRCEGCAPGFFGDPAGGAGSCQPCRCHGNIDTTDPEACDGRTGRCRSCLYHTEGDRCQLCRLGYYGDALRQDCRSKARARLPRAATSAFSLVIGR